LGLDPIEGSKEAVAVLKEYFELFVLSTPSWGASASFTEKIEWIKNHYGSNSDSPFYKRVVLTHRKDLLIGDYLIDDRTVNGAKEFTGEFIHFGSEGFETWEKVLLYIINKEACYLINKKLKDK
jgi:5'-nucleotidase